MTYNNLLSNLPAHTELHSLTDVVDQQDQHEYASADHSYILFSYTTNMPETILALTSNNIDYTIKTDSYGLDYILI